MRARIVVPSTVLHKDETIEKLGFTIPRQYIRFMQHRHSQMGVKLSEIVSVHYSLYKQDFDFVEAFNARCPETPITLVRHLFA